MPHNAHTYAKTLTSVSLVNQAPAVIHKVHPKWDFMHYLFCVLQISPIWEK